jgi:PAS domain S-box-containing protein
MQNVMRFLLPKREALRESENENYTRVVAETASDAIITIDEHSTIIFVNPSAERIFGFSIEEMHGSQLTMLMPDYLRHVHRAGLSRYLETGERHISWKGVELPGLHKNGQEIALEVSFGEFTKDGKHFFTGIARDISARKRDEQRLRAQHAVTRILSESATLDVATPQLLQVICESLGWAMGALWTLDRDADQLHCVETWHLPSVDVADFDVISREHTFARGIGLPGRVWASREPAWVSDVVSDDNFPRAPYATRAGLHGGLAFPVMLGSEFYGAMEFFSREVQQPDEALLQMMSSAGSQIGQFIGRRRLEKDRAALLVREQKARADAEQSEQRYRHLADAMPQIVWTARPDGWLDYYNQRWFEYTGLTLQETEGWGWQPVIHPEDVERCLRGWSRAVETGETYEIEYRFKRASDNSYRWHLGRATPLRDESGQIIKWFGTCTDIHEQKLAQEALQKTNRVKDEFLATLSHELRTPLTPIIGWVHMLRNGQLPEDSNAIALATIDKSSQSLKKLINDLLDMSAILSGKMRLERASVSLNAVIEEAVETVRPQAAEKMIEIEVRLCEGTAAPHITGDRVRLVQVFWNLLSNAIKFSESGQTVLVRCETTAAETRVHVEDQGRGINSDFMPHIFEHFRQADSSNTRSHGGLGLGLALVKNFVEAHGGRVTVDSEGEGRGSRLTVHLPAMAAQAPTADQDAPVVKMPKHSLARYLLIVEDEEDTLDMLRVIFEKRDYRVTACENATEALRLARSRHFDLIISDIGMPGLNGYELLKQLRQMPHLRETPAIALTGYAMPKDMNMALEAGFNAHVAKPVDPDALVSLVRELLQPRLSR